MRLLSKDRLRKIKESVFTRPYFFLFFFFGYLFLNVFLNKINFYILFSFSKWFLVLFVLFNFIIVPGLVALNLNLLIKRYYEQRSISKSSGFSAFGAFMGVLGGACPGCFVGVFSSLLGLMGVSLTLGALPLYGLEIQLGSSIILITAVFLLTKENTCKIKV